MLLRVDIEIDDRFFLDYYNKLDYTVTNDLISGTDMVKPFKDDDIPTIITREIEGWINGAVVKKNEKIA